MFKTVRLAVWFPLSMNIAGWQSSRVVLSVHRIQGWFQLVASSSCWGVLGELLLGLKFSKKGGWH